MSVNTWEFDTPSSCEVITWVVVGFSVLPSLPLMIQMRYWKEYSRSSMKCFTSLLRTVMRPEFIVGDGTLWLRSGRICSISYSVIKLSFVSSNDVSCSTSASSMSCYCMIIRRLSSRLLSIGLICLYKSSKRTDFNFGRWQYILAWGGAILLDVSVFYWSPLVAITF